MNTARCESQCLSQSVVTKYTVEFASPRISAICSSMQGWRGSMDDAHILNLTLDEDTYLIAVFAEHGGKDISLYLGRHFAVEFVHSQKFLRGDMEGALKHIHLHMDHLIMSVCGVKERYSISKDQEKVHTSDLTLARRELPASDNTAVIALVRGDQLWVASPGDSRCVLVTNRRPVELTVDHKATDPGELKRIRETGGRVDEDRVNEALNLTRSRGDFEYKTEPKFPPERQPITALPEVVLRSLSSLSEFLVLGCDGVWDMVTTQELVNFLYEKLDQMPLRQIAELICNRCVTADTQGCECDNLTSILVENFRSTESLQSEVSRMTSALASALKEVALKEETVVSAS